MKFKDLKFWLQPIDDLFLHFDRFVLDKDDDEKHRIFIDNGGDVLFVAHLDTVLPPKIHGAKRKRGQVKRIYAQGLDDRLGALVAHTLSQELGADLLLTDHEESIATTAEYHNCKNYNWIAEFDRAGSDVVTYDLDSKEWRAALEQYFKIGIGSFSDVCELNTTAAVVNIGIGYHNAHAKDSYVQLSELTEQLEKFRAFFAEYGTTAFERDADAVYRKYGYSRSWTSDYYYSDFCDVCGCSGAEEIFGYMVCKDCIAAMVEQFTFGKEDGAEEYDGNAYNAYMR